MSERASAGAVPGSPNCSGLAKAGGAMEPIFGCSAGAGWGARMGSRRSWLTELFGTGESGRADEPDLRLFRGIGLRRENFGHAVVDDLHNERATRLGFDHHVRRLDIRIAKP